MAGMFSKDRIVAGPGFNRWLVPPASIAIHLCIGSVYAWSVFNLPLERAYGVVDGASEDWSEQQVVRTYMLAIVFLGLTAAFAGKWLERVGPRLVGTVAAVCWGGGFLVGAVGVRTHQLALVYLGYGVIGGCGLGLGYVSPVSTLIRWFPDRRGMAAGMAIMGFGGGAMIGAPLKKWLLGMFHRAPEHLGTTETVSVITHEGKRVIETAPEQFSEVIEVALPELAGRPELYDVYLVGTGNTGVAETFVVLGLGYFVIMLLAAFAYRIPAEGWSPRGWTPPEQDSSRRAMISRHDVGIDQAMKTPQFYLVWIVLCFNVTAGIGVIGVAKTMIGEIFGTTLPQIVNEAYATFYVTMLSLFNMLGRFFWASISDWIGRKLTYTIFFVLGIALYLSIPFTAAAVSVSPAVVWLVVFYGTTLLILTMYGGGFATIPAYLADLFGTRFVGGIHGRLLTAWSVAGILGPMAITSLRERERIAAIDELVHNTDPAAFKRRFDVGVEQLDQLVPNGTVTLLDELVSKGTVTLGRLMEIAPQGTIDPRATLYNSTMFLMASLLAVALVANLLIRPVAAKHHLDETE